MAGNVIRNASVSSRNKDGLPRPASLHRDPFKDISSVGESSYIAPISFGQPLLGSSPAVEEFGQQQGNVSQPETT